MLDPFPVAPCDPDLIAVRDPEQLFVVRRDEADTAPGILHVPVQMLRHIREQIEIVVARIGMAAQQIAVLLCVDPKSVFPAVVPVKACVCVVVAEARHFTSAGKQAAGLPQGIDHPVELLSERICFVPAMSVLPGGEKFPAIPAKVSAQTSDAACLALKLRALPVCVQPFPRLHRLDFQLHHRSPPFSFPRVCAARGRRRVSPVSFSLRAVKNSSSRCFSAAFSRW